MKKVAFYTLGCKVNQYETNAMIERFIKANYKLVDFEEMKKYILGGGPTQGVVRFFSGYAGWMKGQLRQEIEDNIWLVNNDNKVDLLNMYLRDLWQETLTDLGGKYAIWARYPQFPSMN